MISVIIPTYNEESALPDTLTALCQQPMPFAVYVVDGGSTDRTGTLAEQFPHITVLSAPKGRASQMNSGAVRAIADHPDSQGWLVFLHADTLLPSNAFTQLRKLEEDHNVQAGGFLHQFSGDDWKLRMISWLDNFRCFRSRIIYGDQAMFVRQELFQRLGGFPDQPILEDVAFCERLIRHTIPKILSPPVITDSRKFVKMGVWRSLARVFLIILCVEFRLPILTPAFFKDIR